MKALLKRTLKRIREVGWRSDGNIRNLDGTVSESAQECDGPLCLIRTLNAVQESDDPAIFSVVDYLRKHIPDLGYQALATWNDTHTQAEVEELLERAIKAASE